MEIISVLVIAIVLFVSTNIDDIFVLLSFFADPRYKARHIVLGQYLGIATLVIVSVVASLVSLVLPPAYVGFLGLLPIAIGSKKLFALWQGQDSAGDDVHTANAGNVLAVAAVTIANGGDNIGIYTPVFATSSALTIAAIILVFAIMVAVWLAFAHWLMNHPVWGSPIRKFGHVMTPLVLIAVGIFVLHEADSFSLLH